MICALLLTILLLLVCCCCWFKKSQVRHVQRLQRRNSIRQSIRSLNSIGGGEGSLRRRNMNMSRSNDILSTTGTDYKKMESNGSFDSMEKAAVESDGGSYENYDPYTTKHQAISPNTTTSTITNQDILGAKYAELSNNVQKPAQKPMHVAQIGNRPKIYSRPTEYQNGIELAFRNEGFRDNSTTYSGGTRQNSLTTVVNEGTPIINQTEANEETGSDYYGNSSTLPAGNRNLSFLIELKNRLPEYETLPRPLTNQSSFLPPPPETPPQVKSQAINAAQSNRNSMDSNGYHKPTIRKPQMMTYSADPQPAKRPDSYYTAMKTARESTPAPPVQLNPTQRPRTVYEASGEDQLASPPPNQRSTHYSRSKSEALLETNFDDEPLCTPLSPDNRSHSQPLETAM